MIDFTIFSETNKTVTFSNGKTFNVFSKETAKCVRYYYYSTANGRLMPVSAKEIK